MTISIDAATAAALLRFHVVTYVRFLKEMNYGSSKAFSLAAERRWPDEQGHLYSASTIEHWWYSYTKHGFDCLLPRKRSDKGSVKALTEAERLFVSHLAKAEPHLSITAIQKQLCESRPLGASLPSCPTLYRYLGACGLNYDARIKLRSNQSPGLAKEEDWSWMLSVLQGQVPAAQLAVELKSSLPEDAVKALYECAQNKPLRFRNRALAVLCHHKGIKKTNIQSFLRVGIGYVDSVLPLYERGGVERIVTQKKTDLKKPEQGAYREAVFSILHSPPSVYGINRTTWKQKDIQKIMAEMGLPVGVVGISKIIRSAKYTFRKAKKVLTSNDPDYKQKLQEITNILRNLKPDEKFFSVDEFGPFAIKIQGGRSLMKPGECKTVPQYQKSKGRLILTAALELSENQVTHFYSEKKNTNEMLKLLELLLVKHADQSCIYFSWDAASWHASKKLYKRVEEVNSVEYQTGHKSPLVKLAPLPSCAQFLNVIESVFSGMARAIIHNSDYQCVDQSKSAIDRYYADRNQHFKEHPKRAGKQIWGRELVAPVFDEANNCKDPRY